MDLAAGSYEIDKIVEITKIKELLESVASGGVTLDTTSAPPSVILHPPDLRPVMERLFNDPSLYFDSLSCVTGIDNGVAAGTMEVVYHLYSIPFNHSLAVKVTLPRENPEVESLTSIWKSANWLERETYDMFGIRFLDHPDLRRILLPADWEGYPLRKDYQHQERYRNVQVKY